MGLDKKWGLTSAAPIYRNLNYDELQEHELRYKEGGIASNGAFFTDTGKFTGRSPNDKYTVKQSPSESNVWWGKVNLPITPSVWKDLYSNSMERLNSKASRLYVFDGYCGANPKSRRKVRFITELAWHSHFVRNMFIRPESDAEIQDFEPDFTIINTLTSYSKWKEAGLNSDAYVAFNLEEKCAVIGGPLYGGEMKKGIFSLMNYLLPLEGIMSMHCSANKGKDGSTALFFGLSGTGKTTLSADPNRFLIGDDEHGWDDDGIFNFEGGCYAKTDKLKEENEPEIFRAIRKDALLENVWINEDGTPDYFNIEKTENGRVSYPLYHIANHEPTAMGTHPKDCLFLTCDSFGVLPPIARLNNDQAMYHFLSGFTSKVAGTERGIVEPQPTFSPCFGSAFLTLHPTVYADIFKQRLEKYGTQVYLVNTGWSGGAYGVGSRMSIKITRSCVSAILDGSAAKAEWVVDPVFGFEVPKELSNIPKEVLIARESWADKEAYDAQAKKLSGMFKENFKKYVQPGKTDYTVGGPI
jgi:ATP-dependent phosphoenolpyruvate carboxykinase